MNSPPESDESPSPSELGALRAATLWLLIGAVADDEDRVGDESVRLYNAGKAASCFAFGLSARHAARALIDAHGSQEAAIEALQEQLVTASLTAAEDEENE